MIYLNLGRREVGKTTLAAYLIKNDPVKVVFDPRGLYPADDRLTQPADIQRAMDDVLRGNRDPIVITPDDNMQGCFNQACAEVKKYLTYQRTGIAFLIDELRFIDDVDTPAMNWILRFATRDSVTVVFTAHRPKDVPPDIRAIADVWCVFQMTQPRDLEVIEDQCSPSVAALVGKLPPRHFISWDDARGKMREHNHPDRWHIPLRTSSALAISERLPDGQGVPDPSSDRLDFTR